VTEPHRQSQPWGEFFLPKLKGLEWTWRRWLLVAFSVLAFIDSVTVPLSQWADRRGEGMVFLILGFRAASRGQLPLSVVIAGGCLTVLSAASSHGLLKSRSVVWTPTMIILMVMVVFWGRRK
jgi:hypothetical protein